VTATRLLNSSMIEQLKQFADRQTPVSLLLALVGVIFAVMTCIEVLQLIVTILFWILRPAWTVLGAGLFLDVSSNFAVMGFQFTKILGQVVVLLILKRFIR
jgi:hypothetical protein